MKHASAKGVNHDFGRGSCQEKPPEGLHFRPNTDFTGELLVG